MAASAEVRDPPAPTPPRTAAGRGVAPLDVAACLAAYLYGSLPFVYLLARRRRVDLRRHGSGNVGAANLWSISGGRLAAVGWLGDVSKGIVPALVARRLGRSRDVAELASVCGMAGQCWPVFLGLSGGRGVSAFVGAALVMNPVALIAALVPMAAGAALRLGLQLGPRYSRVARRLRRERSKSVPLSCLVGVAVFPLACRLRPWRGRRPGLVSGVLPFLLPAVVVIRRLTARLPDDATAGPAVRPAALLYRLLYDRNTSV